MSVYLAAKPMRDGLFHWAEYPIPQLVERWKHGRIAVATHTGTQAFFMPTLRQTESVWDSSPTLRRRKACPVCVATTEHLGVGLESFKGKDEMSTRKFDTEADAVAYLTERLSPYYTLYHEVQAEHFDGSRLRIDLVALPKNKFARINSHRCIGIEIKAGYREGKDFIQALQQCIDYRHSRITDRRSSEKRGSTPDLVLLFPDFIPDSSKDTPYGYDKNWRGGIVRLAGRYNVGIIKEFWHHLEDQLITQFDVSDTRVWDNVRGASGQRNFGTARKRGSQ